MRFSKMEHVMNSKKRVKTATFLSAGVSLVFSVSLWFGGYKEQGMFVGLWVPSIISLGAFTLIGWGGNRG
jgi:hypothetical protein